MPAPLGAKCVWDGSFYPPVLGLGPGRATNPETYAPRAFGHFGTLRNKGANKTRTYVSSILTDAWPKTKIVLGSITNFMEIHFYDMQRTAAASSRQILVVVATIRRQLLFVRRKTTTLIPYMIIYIHIEII